MKLRPKLLLPLIVVLAGLLLSNSSNPPNARTGAPGEQLCSGCHGGGSYSGTVEIDGLPSTVMAGETYTITLTTTATAGNPVTGGFQIVALNSSNQNVGDLIVVNGAETGTETSGGREYMEHRGDKSFSGNTVSWTFDWQAPNGPNNASLKMYFSSVLANNNSGSSGDVMVNANYSFTLQAPTPPTVSITNTENATCNGAQDGSLTATASGGTPPYDYDWSNGQTGATASGLGAGTYTVTVTDNVGQTATAQGTVSQPSPVTVFQVSAEPLTCANPAQVTVGASGGTPGYEFIWSSGGNQSTEGLQLADLPATVTATDNNGCTGTFTVNTLPQDTDPPPVSVQGGTITCSDPTVTLGTAGSGQGNVGYAWSGPNGFASMMQNPQVNEPGTYTLVLTDLDNGCTASASATVVEDTDVPLFILPQTDSIHCNRPVSEITAPPFPGGAAYAWSTVDGQIVFGANAATVGAGKSGLYTVTVTLNSNGCTGSQSAFVGTYADPTLSLDSNSAVTCHGGSDGFADWSASEGKAPYTFLWPDSSTLSMRADLKAGTYAITLTDGHGCAVIDSVTLTQPDPLLPAATGTNESGAGTNDGTASSSPSGGQPPYTFLWSNGNTSASIVDLAPGTYTVTVTDAKGCTGIDAYIVQPFGCNLTVNVITVGAACAGDNGQAIVQVQNANGNVSVSWGNGVENDTLHASAGTYTYVISDEKGCAAQGTATITEPPTLVTQLDSIMEPTSGNSDGAVFLSPTGGTPPYVFAWSDMAGNVISTSEDLTGVPCGSYTLLLTDASGCTESLAASLCTSSTTSPWASQVRMFPVPSEQWLHVDLPMGETFKVELWDLTGRVLSSSVGISGRHSLDMGPYPSGPYAIILTDGKGRIATYKVSK